MCVCVLTSFLLKIRSQAAMFDDQRPHPQQDPIFCCTWAPTGRQVTGCIVRPAPGCAADFGQLPLAMPAHATKSPFFRELNVSKHLLVVEFPNPFQSSVQLVSGQRKSNVTPPGSSRAAAVSQHSQLQLLPATAWQYPALLYGWQQLKVRIDS